MNRIWSWFRDSDEEVELPTSNVYHSGNTSEVCQDYNSHDHRLFSSIIHPHVAIPWTIERYKCGQRLRMVMKFNRFNPLQVDQLSAKDKVTIATQIELVLLFLERHYYQIISVEPELISYVDNKILIHGFTGLTQAKKPDHSAIRAKLKIWLGKTKIKINQEMLRALHPIIVADKKVLNYLESFDSHK
jgi:hypothetical protein